MKKLKQQKGITLVALVITIIVLLILAAISIQALTGTGLFGKTNEAKERTIKAQLKEEIERGIQEIQVEEIPKGNNVTLETLANGQLVAKLTEITASLEKNEITGEYKDYEYTITGKFEINIGNKLVGEKPIITHTLDTEQIGVTQVVITVNASVSDGTIVEITKPDGTIENNVGQVTYTVNKSGKYVFSAKSSNGRKLSYTVKVTNILPSAPVIETQGGYPVLTAYGVQNSQGKVTINYEDSEIFANSYSEDNGATWKEYTGPFEPMASTIIAKSAYREDPTIKVENTKKVIADDALSPEVYDGDESTIGCVGTTQYLIVDNEIQGKKLKVCVGSTTRAYCETYIYSINSSGEEENLATVNSNNTKEVIVTIPNGCVKIRFTARWGDTFNHAYFREIKLID